MKSLPVRTSFRLLGSLVAGLLLAATVQATTFNYTSPTGMSWSTFAPQPAFGDTVNFTADLAGSQVITLDVPATAGTLRLEDTVYNASWRVEGTGPMIFDNVGSTPAVLDLINSNNHYISAPVTLGDDLQIFSRMNGSSGGTWPTFSFRGNIAGGNHGIGFTGAGEFTFAESITSIADLSFIDWKSSASLILGNWNTTVPLTNDSTGLTLRQSIIAGALGSDQTAGMSMNLTGPLTIEAFAQQPIVLKGAITATDLVITGDGLAPKYLFDNNTQGGPTSRNTVQLANASNNAFTGNTSVTGAMLLLDFQNGDAVKVNDAGTLTLNAATIEVDDAWSGTTTQSFPSTTIGAGESNFAIKRNSVNTTLNLGPITRQDGGTAVFRYSTWPNGSNIAFYTNSAPTNGILGGWAILASPSPWENPHFAALGTGGLITAPGTNGAAGYTSLSAGSGGSGVENFNLSGGSLTLSAPVNGNSLRWENSSSNGGTFDNNGMGVTLTSGGLFVINNGNNNTTNALFTGSGTISGADADADLFIYANNTVTTIDSPLIGSGSGALYKSGFGKLILTQEAGYTGGTWINGGVLDVGVNAYALSSGNLRLSNNGQLGLQGYLYKNIGTAENEVQFLTGGGGFSAQGGLLEVYLNGGATLLKADINGNIALNNPFTSTHPIKLINTIDTTGDVTISVGANVGSSFAAYQNNNGVAYSELVGGTTGDGDLLIYGDGQYPGNPNNQHFGTGLLVTSGNLAHTGQTVVAGAGLYLPSINLLTSLTATYPLGLSAGGYLATAGELNINTGSGPGEISHYPTSVFTNDYGFAAVGGPLTVTLNGGATLSLGAWGTQTPNDLVLGSAFSAYSTTFTNNISSYLYVQAIGPAPVVYSGNLSGNSSVSLGGNSPGVGVLVMAGTGNTFTGGISSSYATLFRAGHSSAFGSAGGGYNYPSGTQDLNGYNFSSEAFSMGGNGSGTMDLGRLTNYNTSSTSTVGSVVIDWMWGGGTYFGGDGNLTVNGNITSTGQISGGFIGWRGNGTFTLKGNNLCDYTASGQKFFTRFEGGTVNLDYSTNTGSKLFSALGSGSTIQSWEYSLRLNHNSLRLLGNASTAVTQSLDGDIASGGFAPMGGSSSIKLITAGADLTFNLQRIDSNWPIGTTDFATDSSGGGTAAITTDTPNNTSGLIGGWATWNKTDYAKNSTNTTDGPLGPFDSYLTNNDIGNWITDETTNVMNIDGATSNSLTAHTRIGGLRFDTGATPGILIIDPNIGLTIGANGHWGSLLVTPSTTADVTISGGALNPGGGSLGYGATVGNSNFAIHHHGSGTLTINSMISGSSNVSLLKTGSGTVVLGPNNTYGAGTAIAAGVLSIPSIANNGVTQPLGHGWSDDIKIYGNSTLRLTNSTDHATDKKIQLNIGGGILDLAGTPGSKITFNGANQNIGANRYLTSVYRGSDGDHPDFTIMGTGNATFNGGIFLSTPWDALTTAAAPLVDPDTLGQLILNGTGTITLNAPTNIQGGTIVNSGTLVLGHLTDTLSNNAPVTVGPGATLELADNVTDYIGVLTVQGGTVSGELSSVLAPMAVNFESGAISANLDGRFTKIVKTTSGAGTLSGYNSFSLGIDVQDGSLAVGENAFGMGDLTIAAGGSCSGVGTVQGSVVNNGYLSMTLDGSSTQLNVNGDFTQGATGSLALQIGESSYNILTSSGTLNLDGQLIVSLQGSFTPPNGTTYDILIGNGLVNNFQSSDLPEGFTVDYTTDRVTLTYLSNVTYSTWSANYSGLGEPDADDDHDGLSNLVEYIFKLNPQSANANSAFYTPTDTRTTGASKRLQFSYPRPATLPDDITATIRLSNNLINWTDATLVFDYTESVTGTDPQTVTVTLDKGIDELGGYRFARVAWILSTP